MGTLGAALGAGVSSNTTLAATPASSTSTAMKDATLSGQLVLVPLGVVLRVGPSTFQLQRAMQWAYNKTSATFTTRVTLSGAVGVVLTAANQQLGPASSSSSSSSSLECQLTADLELQSVLFPGEPGLDNIQRFICMHIGVWPATCSAFMHADVCMLHSTPCAFYVPRSLAPNTRLLLYLCQCASSHLLAPPPFTHPSTCSPRSLLDCKHTC
jgi:hypothetical protein